MGHAAQTQNSGRTSEIENRQIYGNILLKYEVTHECLILYGKDA